MSEIAPSDLPRRIELSLAGAAVTARDLEDLCRKAAAQKLYGICVPSSRVAVAAELLSETDLKVTAFVGAPIGTVDSDVKRYETEVAVDYGAQEIEVALNIGRLKDGDRKYILRELRDVAEAADERTVKVDLHPYLLTREEMQLACELVLDSGAHFVSARFANLEAIKSCREMIGEKFGLKAVAEALDARTSREFLDAGATRLGVLIPQFPIPA